MSSEKFREFYEKRHKELHSKGVHGSIGTYHIYDDEGNLVTKNKEGTIQQTLVIPSYRSPSLEELDIMEQERQEQIALATKAYDTAFDVLHQEYQRKDRSAQRVMEYTRRMVEADHHLQHARYPVRYVSHIDKVEIRRIDFNQINEVRKLPYSIAALKVSPFPLQKLYVREGALPAVSSSSSSSSLSISKPILFVQDADTNEYGFMALDWPVQIRLGGVTYHSAKQALAAELAKTFHDDEGFRMVMDAESPAEVNYQIDDAKEATPELWANTTKRHLYDIQSAKFKQYPELQSRLLSTGDNLLAFYQPKDELLGIGISTDDIHAKNPIHWRGQNLMGTVLMDIRGSLREEMEQQPPIPPVPIKKVFSVKRPLTVAQSAKLAQSAQSAQSAQPAQPAKFVLTNHLNGHETDVPGLYYIPNALTPKQEADFIAYLDGPQTAWESVTESAQSRRVQHYGYRYDYKRRAISGPANPIPEEWKTVLGLGYQWNQALINEYYPGQGISAHIDALVYGDTIICYTLGSGATMRFTNTETGEVKELYATNRSVYIMSGDSRYKWKHEMIARKTNSVDGAIVPRDRRISVTLRWVPDK